MGERSLFHVLVSIVVLMLASGALCTGNYQNSQQQAGSYLDPFNPFGSSGPYPLTSIPYYPAQEGGTGPTAIANPQTTVQVAQGEIGRRILGGYL